MRYTTRSLQSPWPNTDRSERISNTGWREPCSVLFPAAAVVRDSCGASFRALGIRVWQTATDRPRNLEIAFPEASPQEREELLRGCFENLGRALGVFSHFRKESPESWRKFVDCDGLKRLAAARETGRGVILFTGHIGAGSCRALPCRCSIRR